MRGFSSQGILAMPDDMVSVFASSKNSYVENLPPKGTALTGEGVRRKEWKGGCPGEQQPHIGRGHELAGRQQRPPGPGLGARGTGSRPWVPSLPSKPHGAGRSLDDHGRCWVRMDWAHFICPTLGLQCPPHRDCPARGTLACSQGRLAFLY